MSFLTAEKIHDGHDWLPGGSVIELSDDGTIISVSTAPQPGAVFYEGILVPGFVNTHCHLELSHMKDVVPTHTGLIPFLQHVPLHRNDFTDEQKTIARHDAYTELLRNGIVAVGDIANTTDTMDVRALNKLHMHTFVESLGFNDANATRSFAYALQCLEAFAAQPSEGKVLRQSIAAHAPYSVSPSLFRLINEQKAGVLSSIHNQESEEEDKYYKSKDGLVGDLLHSLGIDDSLFSPTGKSSLQSYLEWLQAKRPFIFVHNTYAKREDVRFAQSHFNEAYWCLCPNANLYIENKLPDIDMLMAEGAMLCIGTDSLASNRQLSVLSELCSIKTFYPNIDWSTLLKWGTFNGACALQMQGIIGSIAVGKMPGIVHITNLEVENKTPKVTVIY
jgi:cytosine/adenosine deaminase-related metal-dependent hydrolase